MGKLIATIKAIITRIMFGTHGFIAIWQVTQYKSMFDLILCISLKHQSILFFKGNHYYWALSTPIVLLFFEGIFTLAIKKSQEWKW